MHALIFVCTLFHGSAPDLKPMKIHKSPNQQHTSQKLPVTCAVGTKGSNPKTPVQQLKEFCDKNKLEYRLQPVPDIHHGFVFRICVTKEAIQTLIDLQGDQQPSKQEAKHSAARKALARLDSILCC